MMLFLKWDEAKNRCIAPLRNDFNGGETNSTQKKAIKSVV